MERSAGNAAVSDIGRLIVHTSGPWWKPRPRTPIRRPWGQHRPNASINGFPAVPLGRGANAFDVQAGVHRVAVGMGVHPEKPFRYGVTTSEVQVFPGQTTTLYYTSPSLLWARGELGPVRRGSRGRFLAYLFLATACALIAWNVVRTYGPPLKHLIVEGEWPSCIETRANNYDCSEEEESLPRIQPHEPHVRRSFG